MTDETAEKIEPTEEAATQAEVLDRRPPARSQADSALEAAAEAALMLPGLPGRDEFLALAMQARILSMSGAAPEAVRNNPHLAFHIAMIGRDLGISPSAALNVVDVIATQKGPQLSLSPQLINGQIARLGLGKIVPEVRTAERCVALAVGPRGLDPRCARRLGRSEDPHVEECGCDVIGRSEFTWEDAVAAGLAMPDCRPGAHSLKCNTWNSKSFEKCNTGYRNWPARMMWWRASGFAGDDHFPEASIGLYSPEALGAVVDAEGRPIDPADVELPTGYEPRAIAPPPGDEPADPEKIAELKALVARLGPEARKALSSLWTNLAEDGTELREGAEPLPHLDHLRRRQVVRAKAMVDSITLRCKRGELEWAPETVQEGQEAAEKPEPTPESTEPAEAAPGPESAESGDAEDDADAARLKEVHDEAWGIPLAQVRSRLKDLGQDHENGTPEQLRDRLTAEAYRRLLAEPVAPAGSLMDALAEVPTPEPPAS